MWILGSRLEGLALLFEGHHTTPGTLAWESAVTSVRRSSLKGCRENGYKTACGESLRLGTSSISYARYCRHDA